MARKKHAREGARRREAKKDCIRCGDQLDLYGTSQSPHGRNIEHMRGNEMVAVTADDRHIESDNDLGGTSYEGGTYCRGCNNSIEEGTAPSEDAESSQYDMDMGYHLGK